MQTTDRTESGDQQATVLCVGLNVVDLITTVSRYPEEDSDQMGMDFRKQRGGNASNNCTVLSHLKNKCEFLGVLSSTMDPEYRWLQEDFTRHGINTNRCVVTGVPSPTATVLVSQETGSRTIVYCGFGFPELSCEEFRKRMEGRVKQYQWIHFEIRPNVDDYLGMLEVVNSQQRATFTTSDPSEKGAKVSEGQGQGQCVVSVEIEKPELDRPERAMKHADVIFISKDWARSRGWMDMRTAVTSAAGLCPNGSIVVCPWGDQGAAACQNGDVIVIPITAVDGVIDTLGAGDTFVAGFIHARLHGSDLKRSLNYACHLATAKCRMVGYEGLRDYGSEYCMWKLEDF